MRRVLRFLLLAMALLPLGGLAAVGVSMWRALARVKNADPTWNPSWRVLAWARVWSALYRVPYPFMLSILHNENASTPREIRPAEEAAFEQAGLRPPETLYPLGDLSIAKGPSVGAGQVLRVNVLRLWERPAAVRRLVVKRSVIELAQLGNERAALWAAVKIARESLDQADGDLNEAARIYNGGPRYNAAAVLYADNADSFRERLG